MLLTCLLKGPSAPLRHNNVGTCAGDVGVAAGTVLPCTCVVTTGLPVLMHLFSSLCMGDPVCTCVCVCVFCLQAAKNSRVDGLPIITTRALLSELGYDSLAARFESEAVRLDQLLTMDLTHMQMLGLQPLGFCLRLRSAVTELAATLLRRCEERT